MSFTILVLSVSNLQNLLTPFHMSFKIGDQRLDLKKHTWHTVDSQHMIISTIIFFPLHLHITFIEQKSFFFFKSNFLLLHPTLYFFGLHSSPKKIIKHLTKLIGLNNLRNIEILYSDSLLYQKINRNCYLWVSSSHFFYSRVSSFGSIILKLTFCKAFRHGCWWIHGVNGMSD